jgi:hypothetical protein
MSINVTPYATGRDAKSSSKIEDICAAIVAEIARLATGNQQGRVEVEINILNGGIGKTIIRGERVV